MKIITVIARFLLGFIFLVFGLNGFLHFIPSSPPPERLANSSDSLCLPLSGPDISAPDHFGGPAPGQSVRPTRVGVTRSDHRQYPAHSHLDAPEWSAFGSRRDGAVDRRVFERPLRFRRALPTARCGLNKNHQDMEIAVDRFVAATLDAGVEPPIRRDISASYSKQSRSLTRWPRLLGSPGAMLDRRAGAVR